MRLFETANYTIIPYRKVGYVISITLVVISLIAIFGRGLQYGIDFRGGIEIILEFEEPASTDELRAELSGPLDAMPDIRRLGVGRDMIIRIDTEKSSSEVQQIITSTAASLYPDNPSQIVQTESVGPSFADDLRNAAIMSIIFALIVIFLYILIRFKKWSYSAGAVAALAHDVIITLGIFTILHGIVPFSLDINQALIAAFLTIVGYSLNDTVVVFDRIRENSLIFKTESFDKMVNRSINNTLSRTVVTSITTLFVVTILFIFGGDVLKGLSFALIIGVLLGTYSSIFVASSLLVDLQLKTRKNVA
ncbi:protein translocase subunit SecF [Natronogracilivirga saccharolytica]|uniref:Protein-export membrane protein SecF n=1 Tax=Natronogracilivirga saccharolytica TaxID=2812953 RepID=A0A8J7USA6_9BACT|nr:protein translocase subunit SecF [Natronogracilivirga saccharolytica]MBP3191361.1 protein translocase subunit SecF [Natronogracilivirga saccharolytica]